MDGLFPCADVVHEILAPREGKQPAVLDLGVWVLIWLL